MDAINAWILDNTTLIAGIITAIGVFVAIFSKILSTYFNKVVITDVLKTIPSKRDIKARNELNKKIEEIDELINNLKAGSDNNSIGVERQQDFNSRLSNIERRIVEIQNRPVELCSLEYQLILFEVERLLDGIREDNKQYFDQIINRQSTFETFIEQRIGNFKTIFTISLAIVGILITGFGLLIFFIGKGG